MSTKESIHREAVKDLPRPVLLPDVTKWGELFSEWAPYPLMASPRAPHAFAPREIRFGDGARDMHYRDANEIGPFCSVKAGGTNWYLDVIANDAVIAAVMPRIVTPDDALSFKVIERSQSGYALVILEHGYILGSHWLAYIEPTTIPGYELA